MKAAICQCYFVVQISWIQGLIWFKNTLLTNIRDSFPTPIGFVRLSLFWSKSLRPDLRFYDAEPPLNPNPVSRPESKVPIYSASGHEVLWRWASSEHKSCIHTWVVSLRSCWSLNLERSGLSYIIGVTLKIFGVFSRQDGFDFPKEEPLVKQNPVSRSESYHCVCADPWIWRGEVFHTL